MTPRTDPTGTALHPLLAGRWSPRAFDPSHELTATQVDALLEAARWAPSSMNAQPWRFCVALRGTAEHHAVSAALMAGNRAWAPSASALVVVSAVVTGADGRPRPWAAYDTGQAVAQLALQAQAEGLAVHQMGGFARDQVHRLMGSPDGVRPLVVVAVGRHDPDARLAEPHARREAAPRERHPVEELLLPLQADAAQPAAA